MTVNERVGTATAMQFVHQYQQERVREKAKAYLDQYDYAAFANLSISEDIRQLCEYAHRRLQFDLDTARNTLARIQSTAIRALRDTLLMQHNAIQGENALLRELVANAEVKFKQGAYVDFLLRFFRIIEGGSKQRAFEAMGGFIYTPHKWAEDFGAFLAKPENDGLKTFLDTQKMGRNTLKYLDTNPNNPTLAAIVKYYNQHPDWIAFESKTAKLREIRNKGIGGHDFEPTSLEIIEDALGDYTPEQLFTDLKAAYGIAENPFDALNREILRLL